MGFDNQKANKMDQNAMNLIVKASHFLMFASFSASFPNTWSKAIKFFLHYL